MATSSFHFTKEAIEKIAYPKTGRNVYVDSKEDGLILIVSYGRSKVFYLRRTVDGKYRKIKLGEFPDEISLGKARDKAAELKSQINKGIHPLNKSVTLDSEINHQATKVMELTFKELFNRYINDYAVHNTKSWQADIKEMNKKAEHLYHKELSSITREDMQKIFNKLTITGRYGANRFLDRLRTVFNKAIEWELLDKNPTRGIKKHRETARDRYLLAEEEPRFFAALEEEPNKMIRDFILICLHTGARKGNVLAMRWDGINLTDKTWYIPYSKTKNGESHLLPLTEKAMQILKERNEQRTSEWVFPSENNSKSGHLEDPKKAWNRLRKKADLKDFRIHDLRRTRGSWMAIAGASQYVIGKALNHKSPKSTAVYARLSLDPVREYMEKADNIFKKKN